VAWTLSFHLPPLVLYVLSAAIPLLVTLALMPLAVRMAHRFQVLDHPAENKYHERATPYLGGLALSVGLVAVGGIAAGAEGQLAVVVLGAVALSIMGLMDDQRLVRPWTKVVVEVAAALGLWLVGIRGGFGAFMPLDLLVSVLWVVAVTNSINLLDNMDGIAAGVAAISALAFFGIAALDGNYLVASLSLAIASASLGFLIFNFPPARVFMGDAGSLMLGFLLAALGLKLDLVGEQGFIKAAVPVLVLGVPLLDTFLVVLVRLRERRPVYVGGTDHSTHRLAALGLSPRRVAGVVYAVHALSCGVALWLADALFVPVAVTVAGVALVALVLLATLIRIEPRRVRQALESVNRDRPEQGAPAP
jgi:UDP-GlcNAc:undecaprenyl-phosphate GlcNAc-1-phosphate transferase